MTEETSFEKLKKALIDIKDYYPDGIVYGKLEAYFEGRRYILDLLIAQDIFELIPKSQIEKLPINDDEKKQRWYRLAKRGVDLAISMINLNHSEEIKRYSLEMNKFTKILILFGGATLFFVVEGIILNLIFH